MKNIQRMIKEKKKDKKNITNSSSRPGVPSAQHGHFQSHEHISPRQTTRHCGKYKNEKKSLDSNSKRKEIIEHQRLWNIYIGDKMYNTSATYEWIERIVKSLFVLL